MVCQAVGDTAVNKIQFLPSMSLQINKKNSQ
jgi:hypothetical protein